MDLQKNTDSELTILIACHKPYPLPKDDCYLPVEAGATLHREKVPNCIPDNTGDNISHKNKNYCELTVLYWAWKNINSDYLGLVHYRRYFAAGLPRQIADAEDYKKVLRKVPVILPPPRHYWIETNYSQYIHAHHAQDLTVTRTILAELYPDYVSTFDRQMKLRSGHRFNILVMRRDLLDAYCKWLFDILYEIEKHLDISNYDSYHARVFGFVAERLLDVWIETNHIAYAEMPVKNTESQHWIRKGTYFIMRKLTGGKK